MFRRWTKLIGKILPAIYFFCGMGIVYTADANLPFNGDDPAGLEPNQFAFYLSAVYNKAVIETLFVTDDLTNVAAPGLEVDYGITGRFLVRVATGLAFDSTSQSKPPDESPASVTAGLTDTEIGFKWVIVAPGEKTPQLSISPVFIAPTGNARRNLGNGTPWGKVPLWLQQTFGKWTIHGGGGWAFNQALGQQNYAFGGWEAERVMTDSLTLGGALLMRGQDEQGSQIASVLSLGGMYFFTKNLSLLFAGGHSIFAERHTVAYLGLSWTPGKGQAQDNTLKPLLLNRSTP